MDVLIIHVFKLARGRAAAECAGRVWQLVYIDTSFFEAVFHTLRVRWAIICAGKRDLHSL